jgi:hypothetical protein
VASDRSGRLGSEDTNHLEHGHNAFIRALLKRNDGLSGLIKPAPRACRLRRLVSLPHRYTNPAQIGVYSVYGSHEHQH